MGAQHTPGRLSYSSALPRFHGDEVEAYAYYCIVWQATDDPEEPAKFCETPDRETMAEAYRDARLIAAAPELLSSLSNAVEFIAFYFTGPDAEKNRDAEGMKNMLAEAEAAFGVGTAAIAKARGAA
jgi:hypothetical protein